MKPTALKPRHDVYDLYWKFAADRQDIFFKRLKGIASPWSDNPIFESFKFCNTYRASDRVSQYLIRNVIYSGSQEPQELLFRTVFFRLFNRNETWDFLDAQLGAITLSSFNPQRYSKLLAERHRSGEKIFGGAFILCANKAFGYDKKHDNYLSLIHKMFVSDKLQDRLLSARNLQSVFNMLRSYPLIGNFMAYQIAIDLNYSAALNFSENSFTIAGPGAERGIRKCFESIGSFTTQQVINHIVNVQEHEFQRLGINFQTLWGRPLHAIDCQGLFCELDKYARVAMPELKSNRSRIKTRFKPSEAIIDYFYPPKWKINDLISKTPRNAAAGAKGSSLKQISLPLD